jgi:hypothetical protein
MSTLMEHIHRDADTTPVLPDALICHCAASGSGSQYAPAKNDADSVRADLLPSGATESHGHVLIDFLHEERPGADPTGNEAQDLLT